jgi:hypothetical protein
MQITSANRLSSIRKSLLLRLRVRVVRLPAREHLTRIARNDIAEMAKRWNMGLSVLPELGEHELSSAQALLLAAH